jgi:hypothetical protein
MNAATRIPAEYRFPLHLEPSIATVWGLYNAAKQDVWDPADLPWGAFRADDHAPADLAAAALVWSHRLWVLYGRLSESPALLVRFCLERQRESDPKYMLSMRGSADAWHVDACERMAAALGGVVSAPADPAYAERFNLSLHREALTADMTLDSYVGAYVAYRDTIDAALLAGADSVARDPLAKAVLSRLAADRSRQADFGWLYLQSRAGVWTLGERSAIAGRVAVARAQFVDSGVLLPAPGAAPSALVEAYERAEKAGLGGVAAEGARRVLAALEDPIRQRFAALDVRL